MKRTVRMGAIALLIIVSCIQSEGSQSPAGQAPATQAASTWTVPSDQKFILQLETSLHTHTTRKGDRVEFSTAADVVVQNQVILPNKSLVRGTVTQAKRAGRVAGRAEIQLRLDEIRLSDGTTVPLHATITRVGYDPVHPENGGDPKVKGEAGAGTDVRTIAKAGAEGALIGVLSGGARGAMIGSVAGVLVTTAGMIFRRGPDLDLPAGTMMEAKFDQSLTVPAAAVAPPPPPVQDLPAAAQTPVPLQERTPTQRPKLTRADQAGPPPIEYPQSPEPPETPPAATTAPPVSGETQPAASGGLKLSVNVRMVLVDAVVKDRSGRMMENLKQEDFVIYEDGVKEDVQSFSRDELPLAIALVLDRSGSESPYIYELRRIAERTLDELKPEDEVALFSFAADVQCVEELTANRRRIADGINRIRAGGGTDIVDALHEAATYLKRQAPDRRHAIILISDNQQTVNPRASETETIKVALESETVVYSIKTQGESRPFALQLPSVLSGPGPVGKVTQETGGEIINASSVTSFGSALSSIISHLRLRYSIGYYPPGSSQGAFHSIVVRLDDRFGKVGSDYFINTRRGYYSTADRIRTP